MLIHATVNGTRYAVDVGPADSLLTVLRDHLGLTGTKNACEEGECGSCSVWLDGEPVCSCLVPAVQADGREVRTVEALGSADALHPLQDAFLAAGAVQCGFCTPGLLVAAADLLERKPDPDDDEIREALAGNFCRCTGYQKVVDAVHLASGRAAAPTAVANGRVGESARRVDGVPKVTGRFAYGSDLHAEGMLHGVTVRSPHASARIRSIDVSSAAAAPGVRAVLTADDVPGRPTFGLEYADQPVLASQVVRYEGEPVALVAADTLEQARRAAELVDVDYEPLPVVGDMEDALRRRRAAAARPWERPPPRPHRERRPGSGRGGRVGRGVLRDGDAGPGRARARGRARPPHRRTVVSSSARRRSGSTSTSSSSRRASTSRRRRCGSRSPASAARSGRARTSTCRSTPACSRCARDVR